MGRPMDKDGLFKIAELTNNLKNIGRRETEAGLKRALAGEEFSGRLSHFQTVASDGEKPDENWLKGSICKRLLEQPGRDPLLLSLIPAHRKSP
jgi:hypothetical protein